MYTVIYTVGLLLYLILTDLSLDVSIAILAVYSYAVLRTEGMENLLAKNMRRFTEVNNLRNLE